jgi:uncharacterized protein (TIGR04255 family)
MARYLPFAGRNSIAEMNIGIQFASPFDQTIGESMEVVKAEFAADFPKFEPLQMITINIGLQQFATPGASTAPTVSGFNLTKAKADGSPARVLRVMTNVLSVHFLEYTSWKEIKPQAINYLTRCLEKLGILNRNPAVSILLRYIDRFTFDGAPQDASAGKLLRPDTKFVAARILNRGYQWHSNCAWFEPMVDATMTLNQLNVSGGIIQATTAVIVDHNSIYNLPKPSNSIAELKQGGEGLPLEAILDRQHRANADLLKNLLNQEMLDTIGLKV